MNRNSRKDKSVIVCRCNNISRKTLEDAIEGGCDTMNKIFDETTAGVGPCGGSCRRKIVPLLEHYLKTGHFPEKLVEDLTGKQPPGEKVDSEKTPSADSTDDDKKKNS